MQNLSTVEQIRLQVARENALAATRLDTIHATHVELVAMIARLRITVEDLIAIIERGDL